jgi:hypothetical protein
VPSCSAHALIVETLASIRVRLGGGHLLIASSKLLATVTLVGSTPEMSMLTNGFFRFWPALERVVLPEGGAEMGLLAMVVALRHLR